MSVYPSHGDSGRLCTIRTVTGFVNSSIPSMSKFGNVASTRESLQRVNYIHFVLAMVDTVINESCLRHIHALRPHSLHCLSQEVLLLRLAKRIKRRECDTREDSPIWKKSVRIYTKHSVAICLRHFQRFHLNTIAQVSDSYAEIHGSLQGTHDGAFLRISGEHPL